MSIVRVAAFTSGKWVPSSRFRVRQYKPVLERSNVELKDFPARLSTYPPASKALRPLWVIGSLSARLPQIWQSHKYDITLLQRTMISTYMTLEPLTSAPRILDIDDAIFLRRNGTFLKRIVEQCVSVFCGNDFLAEHVSRWNPNITIIPTAVDVQRYKPIEPTRETDDLVIGWIGSSSGLQYLYSIEDALRTILGAYPQVRVRVISDQPPNFRTLPSWQVEFHRWSVETEVASIQNMTIGIMPLADSEWERGKCSYKMLQYLACGLPVVVSPVGMNAQVLSLGTCGIAASTRTEWQDALSDLLISPSLRREMGRNGRDIVEKHFSLEVIARLLSDQFHALR